jgi:hypothetical protein
MLPANVVQKPLGYLNSSITMNIYTHRAPEVEVKAAKVLDSIFSLVVSKGPEPLPPLTLIFEIFPANRYKKRADERTRTADLPSLRVIISALQGSLPCVAPRDDARRTGSVGEVAATVAEGKVESSGKHHVEPTVFARRTHS